MSKNTKNRNKPHWRSLRSLCLDAAYDVQWRNITNAYWASHKNCRHTSYNRYIHDLLDWLVANGAGFRKVYDMVYNDHGINFDDDSSKIQFMLEWAEK